MKTRWVISALLALPLGAAIPVAPQTIVEEGSPDSIAFHRLASDLDSAWNGRDATMFAGLFLEDADFQFHTGDLLVGREQIEKYYASRVFPGMPADRRHTTTLQRSRFLAPGVAIGGGSVVLSRAGTTGEEEPYLRLLFTSVVVKRDGEWRIAAVRLMVATTE